MYLFSFEPRVPNKQTGLLLENEKKSHLYTLIRNYSFINFQQKVPPIRLFPPILLFFFVIFGPPKVFIIFLMFSLAQIGYFQSWDLLKQSFSPFSFHSKSNFLTYLSDFHKNRRKFPPILLFRPICLLVFQKFSHLYVYSVLYSY